MHAAQLHTNFSSTSLSAVLNIHATIPKHADKMGQKVMRLPPLRNLRVTNPNQATRNPCISVMATLLSCWASQGYTAEGCGKIEEQLRGCMDAKKGPAARRNNINYHLGRLYPRIKPPHKKWKGYQ